MGCRFQKMGFSHRASTTMNQDLQRRPSLISSLLYTREGKGLVCVNRLLSQMLPPVMGAALGGRKVGGMENEWE